MRREIMIAKLRKQQEEIKLMVKDLEKEGIKSPLIREAFGKRIEASENLIVTIQDKSFIPASQGDFDVDKEMKHIEKKLEEVLEGIRKLEKLEAEKKKIEKKLTDSPE